LDVDWLMDVFHWLGQELLLGTPYLLLFSLSRDKRQMQ
jgi:hypothetical protein